VAPGGRQGCGWLLHYLSEYWCHLRWSIGNVLQLAAAGRVCKLLLLSRNSDEPVEIFGQNWAEKPSFAEVVLWSDLLNPCWRSGLMAAEPGCWCVWQEGGVAVAPGGRQGCGWLLHYLSEYWCHLRWSIGNVLQLAAAGRVCQFLCISPRFAEVVLVLWSDLLNPCWRSGSMAAEPGCWCVWQEGGVAVAPGGRQGCGWLLHYLSEYWCHLRTRLGLKFLTL
jgi:hypothetical protein